MRSTRIVLIEMALLSLENNTANFLLIPMTSNTSFTTPDIDCRKSAGPGTSHHSFKVRVFFALLLCLVLKSGETEGFIHQVGISPSFCSRLALSHRYDTEEEERLLLSAPAVAAYLQAEVRVWLLDSTFEQDDFEEAAVAIANAAQEAYLVAKEQDVLSHHGALISFLQTELRNSKNSNLAKHLLALATNPYAVAKYSVDLLHHRLYRGTYTTTLQPNGIGEVAARQAVGLPPPAQEEEDTCIVEPPPEIESSTDCLWNESDDVAWRKRRFEKITMEGWRDPRRGNSGTSR